MAWSAHAGASNDGVLIGGCEDGTVSFWSASDLLSQSNSETTLIARCEAHQGPVRGLQVNPFQPFLVASGATDAEVSATIGRGPRATKVTLVSVDLALGFKQFAATLLSFRY